MQFKLELIQAMRDGEKSQTRRVKREGEYLVYYDCLEPCKRMWNNRRDEGSTYNLPTVIIYDYLVGTSRIKWQVGRRYAIQPGRGKKAVGSYECVALREQWLQDISVADCRAESIQQYQGSTPYTPWGFPGREGGWLGPRRAFMGLWNMVAKKGERWADNPTVIVIEMGEFEWL